MRSWFAIRARAEGAEVSIYDEIGAYGVSAKSFLDEISALPDDGPLTLRLNSPGGSVFDAVAIYNALKRHAGPVSVWIDGIAASAASYVAMAGDEVVMPENAFLMIHDPSGVVMGTAEDMRDMAGALDKIKGSLVAAYVAKSGGAEDDIAALMAKETWLDAAEAVEFGFADRLAEPVRIAASFDVGRFRNAPPALVEAVEAACDAADDDTEDGAAGSEEVAALADDVALKDVAEQAAVSAAAEPPAPPGAADADPAAEAPGTGTAASDPAPEPAAIRAEIVAHAAAVIDLCALAGLPLQARRFLEAGASLDEVRAALLAARADATPEVTALHPQPGRPADARPWGEVIARTFKPRG
jgi:ATP-dependent protease ClpP protease subunit